MEDDAGAVYKLAYDEAVRGLSQQQSVLESFRTRAGILLSAAAIATSFLGGTALQDGELTRWSWLAIVVFGLVGLAALFALWPRKDWEVFAAPRRLIETYVETASALDLAAIRRDLALHMEDSYDENAKRLQRLIFALARALFFSPRKSSHGSSTSQVRARLDAWQTVRQSGRAPSPFARAR